MSRPRSGANLSISELERILEQRKTELHQLKEERAKLQKRLEMIEEQILRLGGEPAAPAAPAAPRVQNDKSLPEALEAVLQANGGGPLRVAEIAKKVQEAGYKTSSANFRGIVNQTLIKDKKFVCSSRGFYSLASNNSSAKKAAKEEAVK